MSPKYYLSSLLQTADIMPTLYQPNVLTAFKRLNAPQNCRKIQMIEILISRGLLTRSVTVVGGDFLYQASLNISDSPDDEPSVLL